MATSNSLNVALTVGLSFLAIGFAFITFNTNTLTFVGGLSFNSSQQKISILISIAFYCSIIMMMLLIVRFILSTLTLDQDMLATIKTLIINQLEQLTIFLGLYGYVLFKVRLDSELLVLFPNWFMVGRVMEVIGGLLQMKLTYNMREFGYTLNILGNVMMIWFIFNQQPVLDQYR